MIRALITWIVTFAVLLLVSSLFGMLGTVELAIVLFLSIVIAYGLLRLRRRPERAT